MVHGLREHDRVAVGEQPGIAAFIDTTVPGTVVRSMLACIDEFGPTYQRHGDWAGFLAFRDGIQDDAEYAVKAIEA
jgi:hypothetical protein